MVLPVASVYLLSLRCSTGLCRPTSTRARVVRAGRLARRRTPTAITRRCGPCSSRGSWRSKRRRRRGSAVASRTCRGREQDELLKDVRGGRRRGFIGAATLAGGRGLLPPAGPGLGDDRLPGRPGRAPRVGAGAVALATRTLGRRRDATTCRGRGGRRRRSRRVRARRGRRACAPRRARRVAPVRAWAPTTFATTGSRCTATTRRVIDARPRVCWSPTGASASVRHATSRAGRNAMTVGGGSRVYGAQGWRFFPDDFRMATPLRRSRRQRACRLADHLRGPRAVLRARRVGGRGCRRRRPRIRRRSRPRLSAAAGRAPTAEALALRPGPTRCGGATGPVPLSSTRFRTTAAPTAWSAGNASASRARPTRRTAPTTR